MYLDKYTVKQLEKMNAMLAHLETDIHNTRTQVIRAIQIKRELRDDSLPKEERDVLEDELEDKFEAVEYSADNIAERTESLEEKTGL